MFHDQKWSGRWPQHRPLWVPAPTAHRMWDQVCKPGVDCGRGCVKPRGNMIRRPTQANAEADSGDTTTANPPPLPRCRCPVTSKGGVALHRVRTARDCAAVVSQKASGWTPLPPAPPHRPVRDLLPPGRSQPSPVAKEHKHGGHKARVPKCNTEHALTLQTAQRMGDG